jgi:GDP-L-fucose synthase
MHEAKQANAKVVVIWGNGTPRREFLYSEDMADACLYLLEQPEDKLAGLFNNEKPPLVNIGWTIRELAVLTVAVIGFKGRLTFDTSKPDGTMRKMMDVSRIRGFGWKHVVSLAEDIKLAYGDFIVRCP